MQDAATSTPFRGTSRFELRARLGEGAVGVVYEAYDREQRSVVALKTLGTQSAETLLHLKSEFRAVQDLQHPNLVQLGELIEEGGAWFFTMELVRGADFVDHVRGGPVAARSPAGFDEARLRSGLAQLARGLRALHAAAKVHRDVKPSNVLVARDGRVVLLDFGIVQDLSMPAGADDDAMLGTPAYMAPEQAESGPVTAAADWYAVGVVLFQALTGDVPFRGGAHEVLTRKLVEEAPAPSTRVRGVPADLDALCVELLARDPEARPGGAEVLERLGEGDEEGRKGQSGRHAIFVGRRDELTALDEAFDRVLAGGRSMRVWIEGESGVGKSRLAASFAARALERHPEALRLAGRCYERESVPYKAVDGVIDALAKALAQRGEDAGELLPPGMELLAKAFPVLGPLARQGRSSADSGIASPQVQRARVVAVLRELLSQLTAEGPVLVVIDDMQWADPDSLALLREVLRPPGEPPLLLVMTTRAAADAGAAPDSGAGEERRIRLEKLGEADAEELVTRLLGPGAGAPEQREKIRSIVQESGGHPLFIDELVTHGGDEGGDAEGLRLDGVLWRRVGRLESPARRLLELTAVAGLPVAQSTAGRAAGLDDAELTRLATTLRAERLVRTTGITRTDTIEPYHDRVRESVLAHLDVETRRGWHRGLALALEATPGADPEVLATHWEGAPDRPRAAKYAVAAGDRAAAAFAFDRAARLYRRALELGPAPDVDLRALEGRLAEALTNGGRDAEAAEVRIKLAEGAPPLEALDLRRRAAEQLLSSGHFAKGAALLAEAVAAVGIGFPRSWPVVLAGLLFFRLVLKMRGLSFRDRTPGEVQPEDRLRIDVLRSASQGLSMQDNVLGAYFQVRCLLLALATGDIARVTRAIAYEACFIAIGGSRASAESETLRRTVMALATRVGTPDSLALARTATGFRHFFLGEWAEAAGALATAEELFRDKCIGMASELSSVRLVLYRALAHTGELRHLAASVGPVLRDAEARGDRHSSTLFHATALVHVGLADDRPERVREELRQASAGLVPDRFLLQHYYCFTAEILVDLYTGDAAAALARMSDTMPKLRRSLLLRMQNVRSYTYACRARATVTAAHLDLALRPRLLREVERDIARLRREHHPWADADTALLRASVAQVRGDRAEAQRLYEEAARAYEALHMKLHAASARMRLGQSRADEEGARLARAGEAVLVEEGVKDPVKYARSLAPHVT